MQISDISLPEVYKDSADFRFFCKWFELALARIQYDTENMIDLYDSLRCPKHLLWMLGDTMGYKYDDRLTSAFNRLVILYFMSMIRHKGSKDGITLAAEVNLAQFMLEKVVKDTGNLMLEDRLEDTRIPVNAVYVTPNTDKGYIDVVYFSDERPIDACIEYVRPVGMYVFQHAGVRFDARTKISIDPRLTNIDDTTLPEIGATRVGHYRRDDYARMQRYSEEDTRNPAWSSNSEIEGEPYVNAGYRALYSLQLSNNEHIVEALLHRPIFDLGFEPNDVDVDNSMAGKAWNLRYHEHNEQFYRNKINTGNSSNNRPATSDRIMNAGLDVATLRTVDGSGKLPFVNPAMTQIGDAIQLSVDDKYKYTKRDNESDNVSTEEITTEDIQNLSNNPKGDCTDD